MTTQSTPKPPPTRFWEVDTLRGVAIILMAFYHFVWDLSYFEIYKGNMLALPWQTFARSIATMFIFIMGVSMTLSYHRQKSVVAPRQLRRKYLRRGAGIFGLGMVITGVTYFAIGRGFVVFGILHLLGLSVIIAYPFLRSRWIALAAAGAFIGLGIYLNTLISLSPWFIWLGIKQAGRYMVDYYPLFPWSGFALAGIFAGFTLYPQGAARFALPDLSNNPAVRGLSFLGRHSLLIYLLHQPLLIAVLLAVLTLLGMNPL